MSHFTLLHGFLGSPTDWEPLLSFLPRKNHLLLTLPGHGKRDLPTDNPLLPSLMNAIFKEMKTGQCNLIGYSLGGRLALHFALLFPEKVNQLILISTNPGLEKERSQRLASDRAWADLLAQKGIDSFLNAWYKQPLFRHFKLTPALRRERKTHRIENLQRILTELSPGHLPSLWQELKKIKLPTLFLFGKEDQKYMKVADRLKTLRHPPFAVEMIEEASHAIHLEQPHQVAIAISNFCKKKSNG